MIILLGWLFILVGARRFVREVFVRLPELVGVLQGLGQLGPDRLRQKGGGQGARETDEEECNNDLILITLTDEGAESNTGLAWR